MNAVPNVVLNNSVEIPQIGFGVYKIPPADTEEAVLTAIELGYRHIDTAQLYANEEGVGSAIAKSGVPREELFITTKVWNSEHGFETAIASFEASIRKLQIEVLDLLLIHWPQSKRGLYVETWRALEKLYSEGRVRAIGVSNFHETHLTRLLEETSIVPAINQIELHPLLAQSELRNFDSSNGIATQAWAPLARGALLDHPGIMKISEAHSKTPAQTVLRWQIELGNIAIPKSVTRSRIAENIDIFDFSLTAAELEEISGLDIGTRIGPDPDSF